MLPPGSTALARMALTILLIELVSALPPVKSYNNHPIKPGWLLPSWCLEREHNIIQYEAANDYLLTTANVGDPKSNQAWLRYKPVKSYNDYPIKPGWLLPSWCLGREHDVVQYEAANDNLLTTANVGDPKSDQAWERYKSQFGKSYPPDEESIHRTIFARRVSYVVDYVDYCRKEQMVLDRRADTLELTIPEDARMKILELWSKYHGWIELATMPEWKFGLFTIYYFHRKVMKDCAKYDYVYSPSVEELLF